ncbi:hypothetical protein [Flavicella sediminum]|uniref:hypothetical protein n=1 Tax=Flavicella sediminum TaxID=2585141 RepID=UPI001AA06D28|nr:hypothetical protein [Flavicella sediminum]
MKFNYILILVISFACFSCGSLRRSSDCGLANKKENVQQEIANTTSIFKDKTAISES